MIAVDRVNLRFGSMHTLSILALHLALEFLYMWDLGFISCILERFIWHLSEFDIFG